MFGKLLALLFTAGPGVIGAIDAAVEEYRQDQNNTDKAQRVAKAVLVLFDALGPLLTKII